AVQLHRRLVAGYDRGRDGPGACFLNVPATTAIYTLSLHDALPISFELVRGVDQTQDQRQHAGIDVDGEQGWLADDPGERRSWVRSEEHTSELQSRRELVCRLLLEKNKTSCPPAAASPSRSTWRSPP